jgi:hypothetical protein
MLININDKSALWVSSRCFHFQLPGREIIFSKSKTRENREEIPAASRSPGLVGICRKEAAIFRSPVFKIALFCNGTGTRYLVFICGCEVVTGSYSTGVLKLLIFPPIPHPPPLLPSHTPVTVENGRGPVTDIIALCALWYRLAYLLVRVRLPAVPRLGPPPASMSVDLIQVGPLGYFIHDSITTPVVSASKNYYI